MMKSHDKINDTFETSEIVHEYINMMDELENDYEYNYDCDCDYSHDPYETDSDPIFYWTETEYKLQDDSPICDVDEVYSRNFFDDKDHLFIDNVEKVSLNRYIGIIKFGSYDAPIGVTYKKTNNGMKILSLFERFDNQIKINHNSDNTKLYTKEEDNVYYTEDFTLEGELIVEKDYDDKCMNYGVIQTNSDKIEVLFEYTNYGICIKEFNATYNKDTDDKIRRYNFFENSYTVTNSIKNTFNNVYNITVDDKQLLLEYSDVTCISTLAPTKYKVSIELDSNILYNTVIDIYCMHTREEVETNLTNYVLDSMVYMGMDVEDVKDMKESALQRTGQYNVCINRKIRGNVNSSPFENPDIIIESEGIFEEDIERIMEKINNYFN